MAGTKGPRRSKGSTLRIVNDRAQEGDARWAIHSRTSQQTEGHQWRPNSGQGVARSRGPSSHQWSADGIQDTQPEAGRTCKKSNNEASSGKIIVNKRSGVKLNAQQKVAGGNTKSIHDNRSTKDDIKLMRQLSEGEMPKRHIQNTRCRSVTCNRVSGKKKRVQRTTQVVQETKQATINANFIRMHMEF